MRGGGHTAVLVWGTHEIGLTNSLLTHEAQGLLSLAATKAGIDNLSQKASSACFLGLSFIAKPHTYIQYNHELLGATRAGHCH